MAWKGYLDRGKGMVICEVNDAILTGIDWRIHAGPLSLDFIPQGRVELHFQNLYADKIDSHLARSHLRKEMATELQSILDRYDPAKNIVFSIVTRCEIDIRLLHNLHIAPRDCYEQVQRQWSEFESQFALQCDKS